MLLAQSTSNSKQAQPTQPFPRGNHSQRSGEEGCHPSAECCSPLPAPQGPCQRGALEPWVPVGMTPPELCSPLAARCPVCPRHCKNRTTSETHTSSKANFFPGSKSAGGRQTSVEGVPLQSRLRTAQLTVSVLLLCKPSPLASSPVLRVGAQVPWKEPLLHQLPQGRGHTPLPASQAHGDR